MSKWKTGCTNYTAEIRDCEKRCWQCCVFISSIYLFMYVCIYLFIYLWKLEREKAQHAAEMVELEKKIAELKDQLHKARHGLQDEVGFLKSMSARKSCHNTWMTVMTSFNFVLSRLLGLRKMCSFKGGNSLWYFRGQDIGIRLVKGAMSRWYCCFRWILGQFCAEIITWCLYPFTKCSCRVMK